MSIDEQNTQPRRDSRVTMTRYLRSSLILEMFNRDLAGLAFLRSTRVYASVTVNVNASAVGMLDTCI